MSDALRFGLMGAAQGFLQGMQQNWQTAQEDARTERLQRARQLEEQELLRLQQEYRLEARDEQRSYDAGQKAEDREFKAGESELAHKRRLEIEAERAKRQKAAGPTSRRSPVTALNPSTGKWGKRDVDTGEWLLDDDGTPLEVATPPGGRSKSPQESERAEIAKYVREMNTDVLKKKLNEYGVPAGPDMTLSEARKQLIDAMTAEVIGAPTAGLMSGPKPSASASASAPGSSKDNPIDATTQQTRPPSGTWVRLPSGNVVQVP